MEYLDQLLLGNCLELLPTLPKQSVDLVFADPPYFLQLQKDLWRPNLTQVDGVDDEWDQFENFGAYDDFTWAWLSAVRDIMKDDATIWVSGTYHNIFRVGRIMQDLGFWILNTISWFRPNAMPNFRGVRLKNDIEFVIWAKYSAESRYQFNYHFMKQFNDGKQLGSLWEIRVCGGKERLRDAHGKKLHSTQKPEELLRRVILASSHPGDVVLDPFLGTGTTAAVAKRLHRHWIGIEANEVYLKAARQRLENVTLLDAADPMVAVPKKPVRVAFKTLLKKRYLKVGQQLYLRDSDEMAVIQRGGKIRSNGYVGSIHQVACQLKNVRSCNGWNLWYYLDETTGEKLVLDTLREIARDRLS